MKKQSKLSRYLGAPMRALSRACDFYVRRMTECAGHMPMEAAAVSHHFSTTTTLRSASFGGSRPGLAGSAGDKDIDELIRAASLRRVAGSEVAAGRAAAAVPRSRSVAVERIDEDTPCEFADGVAVCPKLPVARSRSVAVGRSAGGGFGAMRKKGSVLAN